MRCGTETRGTGGERCRDVHAAPVTFCSGRMHIEARDDDVGTTRLLRQLRKSIVVAVVDPAHIELSTAARHEGRCHLSEAAIRRGSGRRGDAPATLTFHSQALTRTGAATPQVEATTCTEMCATPTFSLKIDLGSAGLYKELRDDFCNRRSETSQFCWFDPRLIDTETPFINHIKRACASSR